MQRIWRKIWLKISTNCISRLTYISSVRKVYTFNQERTYRVCFLCSVLKRQEIFLLTQKKLYEFTVHSSNLAVVRLLYYQTEFRKCSSWSSHQAIFSEHAVVKRRTIMRSEGEPSFERIEIVPFINGLNCLTFNLFFIVVSQDFSISILLKRISGCISAGIWVPPSSSLLFQTVPSMLTSPTDCFSAL